MSRIVQCSTMGCGGRFGNQLFSFVFAKAYAEKYDAELQVPANWIGRDLFIGLDDISPIIKRLPKTQLDEIPNGRVNIDLWGYYQFEEAFDFLSYSKIKKWLQFKDKWKNMFPKIKDYYIACHLRRGDYETKYSHIYCTVSIESYERALKQRGYNMSDVIWVTEENALINRDCPYDFLPDFFTLMNSDVLFRSNSTFSVWASILGDSMTFAPYVENITGINQDVRFRFGNWHRLLSTYKGASPKEPAEFIFRP